MAACFACELVFSNMAYQYLSVAFIQMLKAIVPLQTLLAAYLVGKEKPSFIQTLLLMIICSGVAMASAGELQLSVIGVFCQVIRHDNDY